MSIAQLIKADGTRIDIEPANGSDFTYEELQQHLACDLVEVLKTGESSMIFVGDDMARLREDYVVNTNATRIYRESFAIEDARREHADAMDAFRADGFEVIDTTTAFDDEPYTLVGDLIYCPSRMVL